MVTDINWLAVIIGTIGYQVLGAIWYGPLFSGMWMESMGYESHDDMPDTNPTMGYVMTTAGALIAAISLGILIEWIGITTWQNGLVLGVLVGIGFVATTALQAVPFENRSWPTYFLNIGYNILALAGISVLIAVW